MTPAELHQRLEELLRDVNTGDRHTCEVTGALAQAVSAAKRAAVQAACPHKQRVQEYFCGGSVRLNMFRCVACGDIKQEAC